MCICSVMCWGSVPPGNTSARFPFDTNLYPHIERVRRSIIEFPIIIGRTVAPTRLTALDLTFYFCSVPPSFSRFLFYFLLSSAGTLFFNLGCEFANLI